VYASGSQSVSEDRHRREVAGVGIEKAARLLLSPSRDTHTALALPCKGTGGRTHTAGRCGLLAGSVQEVLSQARAKGLL
jgi:hypothetical protein